MVTSHLYADTYYLILAIMNLYYKYSYFDIFNTMYEFSMN